MAGVPTTTLSGCSDLPCRQLRPATPGCGGLLQRGTGSGFAGWPRFWPPSPLPGHKRIADAGCLQMLLHDPAGLLAVNPLQELQ